MDTSFFRSMTLNEAGELCFGDTIVALITNSGYEVTMGNIYQVNGVSPSRGDVLIEYYSDRSKMSDEDRKLPSAGGYTITSDEMLDRASFRNFALHSSSTRWRS